MDEIFKEDLLAALAEKSVEQEALRIIEGFSAAAVSTLIYFVRDAALILKNTAPEEVESELFKALFEYVKE